MIRPDPSQTSVLEFDPTRHARVLGAPGTGKSTVLVEAYARFLARPGWSEADVLAVSPGRLTAATLRANIEARVQRPLGGVPARTPASLAFAVLTQAAARTGAPAPRLLTGTAHDEVIAAAVESVVTRSRDDELAISGALAGDVLRTPAFRAELREFSRVLDDFNFTTNAIRAELARWRGAAASEAHTLAPPEELLRLWFAAIAVIERANELSEEQHPEEMSASALLRAAAAAVRAGDAEPPRLLLVDDAQELGEGQFALLAACAASGSSVWVFGDPDTATAAFHGERTAALTNLTAELLRRGVPAVAVGTEQAGVLNVVHRHGGALRGLVSELTSRIGAAGAAEQRTAHAADDLHQSTPTVRFVRASSPGEQLGMIAHRMRSRRLGLLGTAALWGDMAVICRSRAEAARVARGLAGHQVPAGVAAGGIVLREHRVVRDLIRLLQHALGIQRLNADGVLELLAGPVGGVDPVAVRRLRGALMMQERRDARNEQREPRAIETLVLDACVFPGSEPVVDSAGGRALRRLGKIAAAGEAVHEAGGTARETLWALWDGTKLAGAWQDEALVGRGSRADEANRSLDAVLGLFFALQRHEEQDSDRPIEQLLEELLDSAVPEDTLAQRAERPAVVVTTPQGAVGREFDFVAVAGPQDGVWPNLRSRGSLLGTVAFERWLRGGEASAASRRDTVHDELRLFAQAASRARDELLVAVIADEDHHPSPFFGFGSEFLVDTLPSSRLTLRGATAQMRRRLTENPADRAAAVSLAALAREEVPGAHPDEWYGVLPPSTNAPLYDLDDDAQAVPVSPSRLETAEGCPLNWAISTLGGGSGSVQASIGTLAHHALETAQEPDEEAILATIMQQWHKLPFDAEWESDRAQRIAARMAHGIAAYLREFESSDRELLGREASFSVEVGPAVLRGTADRLELHTTPTGVEVTVLDLKTGSKAPSKAEAEQHVQLQAYQLGVTRGAFALENGAALEGAVSGGARLLYVHPDAAGSAEFIERVQQPLSDEASAALEERVSEIARVMGAASFIARVEHHCSDPYQQGDCRMHIIQAVSYA